VGGADQRRQLTQLLPLLRSGIVDPQVRPQSPVQAAWLLMLRLHPELTTRNEEEQLYAFQCTGR
jgi:hypothetical protein